MTSIDARRPPPWLFVLAGGLIAGTLDIAYVCIFWAVKAGVPAQSILQSVAAGLLAARRWPVLRRRPVLCGVWYGLLLYAIMNFVVVPLSAAGVASKDGLWIGLTIAVHAVLIGVPIALATRFAGEHVDTGGLRSTHG